MNSIKSLSVFCGSSLGNDEKYFLGAQTLGKFLAENHINLVYGGARVGLMGTVADACLKNKGKVTGIIPHFIQDKEIAHENLSELIIVDSMHERKTIMFEKSDGAIVLPGGFGTLDEMFELLTWGQLGLHKKPIGILNIAGYYDHLFLFLDHMVEEGLLRKANRDMILEASTIEDLFLKMAHYEAPDKPKWIAGKEQV
jgi:uncharacterized protein (TIGR00730 family)